MNYKQEIRPTGVSANREVVEGLAFLSFDNASVGFLKMKRCTKCREIKPFSEFIKVKSNRDGLKYWCKLCVREYDLERNRSLDGRLKMIYNAQVQHSKQRGYPPPDYSGKWLVKFGTSQQIYIDIHEAWEDSDYLKELSPSVDRMDNYGYYTKDNIQITTWGQNRCRGYADTKNGVNNKRNIAVRQTVITTNEVFEHYSMAQASRDTGINPGHISDCCNGKRNVAGGSTWEKIKK